MHFSDKVTAVNSRMCHLPAVNEVREVRIVKDVLVFLTAHTVWTKHKQIYPDIFGFMVGNVTH